MMVRRRVHFMFWSWWTLKPVCDRCNFSVEEIVCDLCHGCGDRLPDPTHRAPLQAPAAA